MTEQGPEPTGWELLRAIRDLKTELGKVGDKVVPLGVYAADQKANDDRHVRSEERITAQEKNAVEADKLKRSQRLTISLAFATPVIAALVGWVTGGGLR